jgi:cellulose synthase/poly-beta-1,6-N-acetylglucosamine synthase-like glycosyltransferase
VHFLAIANDTLFIYYALSNVIYLGLLIVAIVKNVRHRHRLGSQRLELVKASPFTPPITLIVPAHNEERSIVGSVGALLGLDYPCIEVIVVNDGSDDATMEKLRQAYQLQTARILYIADIATAPLHAIYRSRVDPRLFVVDKEAAGCKADAINAGINTATSPYICVVDADSILEKESLIRIMAGVFADPGRVMAVGGIVRVLNGSRVVNNQIEEVRLPKSPIEVMQVIEYLRAFLVGREGWACFNMLPIISGAFGVFQRDLVLQVGGFRTHAVGEDLDLVIRMHRRLHEDHRSYHIDFIPDPTCWTEVPTDLKSLARQRARWHKGLIDTLWPNRDMLFRARYGRVGWLVLPYMWIFRILRAHHRGRRIYHHHPRIYHHHPRLDLRRAEQVILPAIPVVRLRLRNADFHRFGTARRNDLPPLQRLARGCPPANLLPLRTLPLPPTHDGLAPPRRLAVPPRRPAMAINDKSRNLHQPSRLTRDLADKVRVFGLAQPFQRRALTVGLETGLTQHSLIA